MPKKPKLLKIPMMFQDHCIAETDILHKIPLTTLYVKIITKCDEVASWSREALGFFFFFYLPALFENQSCLTQLNRVRHIC
jgi:hypothetical protein